MGQIRIDKLIQSSRKTVGLEITPQGKLIVRAPAMVNPGMLQVFLSKKANWIHQKKKLAQARAQLEPALDLGSSSRVLLCGKYYPVNYIDGKYLRFDGGFFIPKVGIPQQKKLIVGWLKRKAKKYLLQRVENLACRLGISYRKVRITSARKRWGSCSAKGNLNFTYRLIMAPPAVIDYVIIHELIHILEHNHSRKFWEKVSLALPDYKYCQQWLKENEYRLAV